MLIGCTNLDLIKVQYDVFDTSSIYSIISADDMKEIPPSSDYTLINSFTNNPYGMTEKYGLPQTMFQHHFDDFEEQLELLQSQNIDLIFFPIFPSKFDRP